MRFIRRSKCIILLTTSRVWTMSTASTKGSVGSNSVVRCLQVLFNAVLIFQSLRAQFSEFLVRNKVVYLSDNSSAICCPFMFLLWASQHTSLMLLNQGWCCLKTSSTVRTIYPWSQSLTQPQAVHSLKWKVHLPCLSYGYYYIIP